MSGTAQKTAQKKESMRCLNIVYNRETYTTIVDKFDRFGEEMSDGRLTAPSDGKVYRLREAILLSKQLGRPLSQEEMKAFEV